MPGLLGAIDFRTKSLPTISGRTIQIGSTGLAMLVFANPIAQSERDTAIFLGNEGSSPYPQQVFVFNVDKGAVSNIGGCAYWEYNTTYKTRVDTDTTAITGNWNVFVVTRTPQQAALIYRNGLNITNSSASASFGAIVAGCYVGNTSTFSNNRGADWPIALVVVLDRALSPQEVWVLSQNPWQIFAPTALNIWSDYVVGGAANWGPLLGLQNNRLIQVQE